MLTGVAYRKTSLIDFPGRVAAVLFFPGCNFRCPYCHNAELVDHSGRSAELASIGEFLAFLDSRKRVLSGLVLSGGEPLLWNEAPRLARAARERGLAIKLDTNGYFPERIGPIEADYVALDLKTAPSRYGRVAPGLPEAGARAIESLRALRASGTDFEVRITCAPGIVGLEDLAELTAYLEPGDDVVLQPFRPGGCLDPAWDGVEPYPAETLGAMLDAVRGSAPRARIRGSGSEGPYADGRSGADGS